MNCKISVYAEYLIILRFAERLAVLYRIHKMKVIQGCIIRLYDGAFKHTQFLNGADFFPIKRLLKPATVVHQHDNNAAAV